MSFKIEYLLPYESKPHVYVVKSEEPTDPQYGCKPENRTLPMLIKTGIVNLDKPASEFPNHL